jgi:tetratricopeptide (TPR) repeat protein
MIIQQGVIQMKKSLLFTLTLVLILSACSTNIQKLSPQGNLDLKSANVYYQQKDNETSLQKALKLYEDVLKDNPEHVIALKRSADLTLFFAGPLEPQKLEKDGIVEYQKIENATKVLTMFQSTYAKYGEVLRVLATFPKLTDDQKVIKRDAQRKKESSWVRMFKIGQIQFDNKNYTDAEKTFEMINKLDETRQEPLRMLVAVYQGTKNDEKFETYLNKVLAVSPNDAEMIRLKGAYLYNKKDYSGAAECFRQTMISNPLDTENMLMLYECYIQLQQYQPAMDILVKVLRLKPDDKDVLISARDLAIAMNNTTAEIDYWKRLISLDSSASNLERFSLRLYNLGQFQDAMEYAAMWYEKDNTNKLAVQTCIAIATKIGRPDLEKKYTDIYKKLQ